MKALPILAAVLGIGVMLALVGYFGAGAVIRSLFAVGGLGFAAICAIHLALMIVMGFAWRVLMPGIPSWVAIWAGIRWFLRRSRGRHTVHRPPPCPCSRRFAPGVGLDTCRAIGLNPVVT